MLRIGNGSHVRVASIGAGPAVVLTHGYPDNLQIWCRVARRLSDQFQVHAFDWPGLGYSEPAVGGATPYHLADQLDAVVNALNLARVRVVGLDMGGQAALVFAARYTDRVERVVATNSLVVAEGPTSWDIRVMRTLSWNERILRRAPAVVFARALMTFLPPGDFLTRELRSDLWDAFRRASVRERLVRMSAGYQASLTRIQKDYRRIEAPVLGLWGKRDAHFPPEQAELLGSFVADYRHEVLDAPHWMPWSHADAVAERLKAFLSPE